MSPYDLWKTTQPEPELPEPKLQFHQWVTLPSGVSGRVIDWEWDEVMQEWRYDVEYLCEGEWETDSFRECVLS